MNSDYKSEIQLLRKKYYKIYFRIWAIIICFAIYFLTVRYFIPNEKVSPLIIFPVFIIALIMIIKAKNQMKEIKMKAEEINSSKNK